MKYEHSRNTTGGTRGTPIAAQEELSSVWGASSGDASIEYDAGYDLSMLADTMLVWRC